MTISANKSAVIWSAVEKFSSYAIQFAITIILGRLLSPNDYAVVAMLGIFYAISQAFIDSGMGTSLIQKKDCTQDDYNSVYYFNIIVSVLIYILLFIAAPFIESFYGFPDLACVLRIYFTNLVIVAFSRVHHAIFCKELQFKLMTKITLVSSAVSAIVAIVMAFMGMKYWALVGQGIASSVIMSLATCFFSSWRPSFTLKIASLKRLAPLGLSILLISLFHAVYNNIYSFVIGKFKTPAELGYYDRARALGGFLPIGMSDMLTKALMPIQSKIQDDYAALYSSYLRTVKFITIFIVPICIFISFYSKETLVFLIGEKWAESSILLSFISFGFMFYPLQNINVTMLKVKAKGKSLMASEILKKTIGILIVCVTVNFGLVIVAIGWMFFAFFEYMVSVYYLRKSIFVPFSDILNVIVLVFAKVALAILVSWFIYLIVPGFYLSYIMSGITFLLVYLGENINVIKHELLNRL